MCECNQITPLQILKYEEQAAFHRKMIHPTLCTSWGCDLIYDKQKSILWDMFLLCDHYVSLGLLECDSVWHQTFECTSEYAGVSSGEEGWGPCFQDRMRGIYWEEKWLLKEMFWTINSTEVCEQSDTKEGWECTQSGLWQELKQLSGWVKPDIHRHILVAWLRSHSWLIVNDVGSCMIVDCLVISFLNWINTLCFQYKGIFIRGRFHAFIWMGLAEIHVLPTNTTLFRLTHLPHGSISYMSHNSPGLHLIYWGGETTKYSIELINQSTISD